MTTDSNSDVKWLCRPLSELNASQLFDLFKLRQDVFILEQRCLYPDIDNKDKDSVHLLGYQNEKLVAYLRIIPPGLSYQEASLGRVAVAECARKDGVGRILVQQGIKNLSSIYPDSVIRIGAQEYLRRFYASFGFCEVGSVYDEDGIAHIEMVLKPLS